MKVATLKAYLNRLPKDYDNKEVTFFDYKTSKAHKTTEYIYVVDENDENYLDFIFNYEE